LNENEKKNEILKKEKLRKLNEHEKKNEFWKKIEK
jgi:hypothetical protein